MTIDRASIPTLDLPREIVQVEALGGDVEVRGFDLPRLMEYLAVHEAQAKPRDGETDEDAARRASVAVVPVALELGVHASDGQPVYSRAQWAVFGARYPGQAFGLYQVVMRLSGRDHEAEKKN